MVGICELDAGREDESSGPSWIVLDDLMGSKVRAASENSDVLSAPLVLFLGRRVRPLVDGARRELPVGFVMGAR